MRFGKIINFGSKRANIAIDVLNLFNANTGTAFQQNYGDGSQYLNPTADSESALRPVQRDGGLLDDRRKRVARSCLMWSKCLDRACT